MNFTNKLPNSSHLYWFINLFLRISKLIKRDKKIWIYGSWLGNKYADNSKYFFEYMNKKHPNIRSVWITKDKEIKEKIEEKGFESYLYNSWEGIKLRLRAGIVLYTNSLMDIGNLNLSQGAYKIALWHGMPFKRIYFASEKRKDISGIKKLLLNFRWKYSDIDKDMLIASSKRTKSYFEKCFKIKKDIIKITGQPRNDIFFDNEKNIKLKDVMLNKAKRDKIKDKDILIYMPTYRSDLRKENKFNKVLKQITKNKKINSLLKQNDTVLIVKSHFLLSKDNIKNSNIIFVNDEEISCTQKLLKYSQGLLTDYSSVFIDFILMGKPVLFFSPDLEEYKKNPGLFENYPELMGESAAYSLEELEDKIDLYFNKRNIFSNKSEKLNKFFNKETIISDGETYSENVYNSIINEFFNN